MKTLTVLLGILFFTVAPSYNLEKKKNYNSIVEEVAVFDGKEGNLYFFTNSKNKALTIEDDREIFSKYFNDAPNDYVDSTFKISIKEKHLKKNVCSSDHVVKIELKN